MQMLRSFTSLTLVVSSGSSATACRAGTRPAAANDARVARNRRRLCTIGINVSPRLGLQLAFELIQEAPIGAFGNDLLRARLDHAHFVQAERVKPDRVLGVVF